MAPSYEQRGDKGLYESRREHDSCGIGAVVSIDGARSHRIIELGNRILMNLQHRGAAGLSSRRRRSRQRPLEN